jgi:hypothetical protein
MLVRPRDLLERGPVATEQDRAILRIENPDAFELGLQQMAFHECFDLGNPHLSHRCELELIKGQQLQPMNDWVVLRQFALNRLNDRIRNPSASFNLKDWSDKAASCDAHGADDGTER